MILTLSKQDVINLKNSMKKLLPSLLTKEEKESCNKIYNRLMELLEKDLKIRAKDNL